MTTKNNLAGATTVETLPNGVIVYQVTNEPVTVDNIYCERSYCTPDSRWFVFQRQISDHGWRPWSKTVEFIACEFGSWRKRVIASGYSYGEITPSGNFYYTRPAANDVVELARVNIATGRSEAAPVDGGVRPLTGITLTPDETHLAYGVRISRDPQMFGVEVADLSTGHRQIVCEDPWICNPHPQIDPAGGEEILIQHNRGCKLREDGTGDPWYDREIGVTLFQVNRLSGRITRLRIGPPHTGSISGHQQWIGKSGKVLLSSGQDHHDGRRKGNLMEVAAGSAPRVVSDAGRFSSHVHASVCGRIFCCDELRTKKISIGSIRTGNAVEICDFGPFTKELYACYGQPSHAHPYLSPDLRWMVFNSCRTGRPQIHVASIPETITADLLAQP